MKSPTTQHLSPAMINLLKRLKVQKEAAEQYAGFNGWLYVGGAGCNSLTGEALIARKLVDVRVMPSWLKRITINADGLAELALATAPAEAT